MARRAESRPPTGAVGTMIDRRSRGEVVYRLRSAEIHVYLFRDVTEVSFQAAAAAPPVTAPRGTDRSLAPRVSASVLVDRFTPDMLQDNELRVLGGTDSTHGLVTAAYSLHDEDLLFNNVIRVSAAEGDLFRVHWTAVDDPEHPDGTGVEIEGRFRLLQGAPIPYRLRDVVASVMTPLAVGLVLGGAAGWFAARALGWSPMSGALIAALAGFAVGMRFAEKESRRRMYARIDSLERAGHFPGRGET